MAFNKVFGELLSEGIYSVAKNRRDNKNIAAIEREIAAELHYSIDTVVRWRRGYLPKESGQVKSLVRYCVSHGRVGYDWVKSILTQARYPDLDVFLRELFPESKPSHSSRLHGNLPPRYGELLDRDEDIARVMEGLASRYPLVAIEGLAGVGKTSLSIEVALRCLSESKAETSFNIAIWVSAKDRPDQKYWLDDLLNAIARTLNYQYILQLPPKDKPFEVDKLLRNYRILIVVDNFETIDDTDLVTWMQNIPEPSKILITSRHEQLRSAWAIHLRGLSEQAAVELIRRQAQRLGLGILETAPHEYLLPLAEVTGGNPRAIEMAIGHVKHGMNFVEVVEGLNVANQTVGDIFSYLFTKAWDILENNARNVLLAMSFFIDSVDKKALQSTTELSDYQLNLALEHLVELLLIEVEENKENQNQRYAIHPLTRAFAKATLNENHALRDQITLRWRDYFVDFVSERCGEKYWGSYLNRDRYDEVEKEFGNILQVMAHIAESKESRLMIQLFSGLVHFMARRNHWEERIAWVKNAIVAAQETGDLIAEANFHVDASAWIFIQQGKIEDAINQIKQGEEIATPMGSLEARDVIAIARCHLSRAERGRKDFEQARLVLEPMLTWTCGDLARRHILTYWGELLFDSGDYVNARIPLEEALRICEKIGDDTGQSIVMSDLGDVFYHQNEYDESQRFFEQALEFEERLRRMHGMARAQQGLARVLKAKGQLARSLELAKAALDNYWHLGMKIEYVETLALIHDIDSSIESNNI